MERIFLFQKDIIMKQQQQIRQTMMMMMGIKSNPTTTSKKKKKFCEAQFIHSGFKKKEEENELSLSLIPFTMISLYIGNKHGIFIIINNTMMIIINGLFVKKDNLNII